MGESMPHDIGQQYLPPQTERGHPALFSSFRDNQERSCPYLIQISMHYTVFGDHNRNKVLRLLSFVGRVSFVWQKSKLSQLGEFNLESHQSDNAEKETAGGFVSSTSQG